MYMYIYIYTYIYIYIYIYIYMCVYINIYIYIHTHLYPIRCAHRSHPTCAFLRLIYTYIYIHIYTCLHEYLNVKLYSRVLPKSVSILVLTSLYIKTFRYVPLDARTGLIQCVLLFGLNIYIHIHISTPTSI